MQLTSRLLGRQRATRSLIVLMLLILPFLGAAAVLVYRSGIDHALEITQWFDPIFFQYNVLLWTLFVLLIPSITYFYVHSMREEREARLRYELKAETWDERGNYILSVIQRQFGMWNYLGSTLTLMLVVAAGLSVLFLLKPLPAHGYGLDYSKGANLFLLGGYMGLSPADDPAAFFDRIVTSLTAFQFGFLGAYVYFIQHLVRSYFTMDLTPNTFVAMSIRMVTAGLVALVLSFALPMLESEEGVQKTGDDLRALLPVVSFGIGYFPDWGMLVITKLTRRMLMLGRTERSASTPLSELSGMSYEHEVRLRRQGYDSVENVAEANLVEMAVRTGFSYAQLRTWVGEAWLHVRFGADNYRQLVQISGVRTADQFKVVFARGGASVEERAGVAVESAVPSLKVKIECVALLVCEWHPEGGSVAARDAGPA